MRIVSGTSHLDHGLTDAHVAFLKEKFADRNAFFIETVELPENLSALECGLYGPDMGDAAIPEDNVTYGIRGNRKCATRFIKEGGPRRTQKVTVIAGPAEIDGEKVPCCLYTAYGGPLAPREPGDLTLDSMEEIQKSREYWSQHALVKG